ncbi:VOC family protein [Streptomyces sp. URMC 129]|uniref:VOC family protein n=1 Tax=Streptomyces sp. URMC 129 TaxID=3423407 RepID=UPI003F1B94CC
MRVERLDHLVLTVADIDATVDFYVRVLGMSAVTLGGGRRALAFGDGTIALHEADREQPAPGGAGLRFVVADPPAQVRAELAARGVPLAEGPVERTVYVRDPDGNLVELSSAAPEARPRECPDRPDRPTRGQPVEVAALLQRLGLDAGHVAPAGDTDEVVETELKARVRRPEEVTARLNALADARVEVYRDAYFDTAAGALDNRGETLRIRTVRGAGGTRSSLTFTCAASKRRHETPVADPEATSSVLAGLGYRPVLTFERHCGTYTFTTQGRPTRATLVHIPETGGHFLEVETLAEEATDARTTRGHVRRVLTTLGITDADVTRELYRESVTAYRHHR